MALLVPLGDLLERRRLITRVLLAAAAAAAGCAAAPSFLVLAAALVAIGALSVVAQIVVPLAATLAGPQRQGQVVGTVMSGLLIGILAFRTLSGLIAALGGWRLVFALAAVLGSLLSTTVYGAAGWVATCLLGAVIALTALAAWAITHRAHELTPS